MTYLGKRLAQALTATALVAGPGCNAHPALAQDAAEALVETPAEEQRQAPPPATLARTFAPLGLIAEFNSNENFAGFQARHGTLVSHQSSANAGGAATGYRDELTGIALPLKATIALGDAQEVYLRVGVAPAWSNAASGNLTETDNFTLSGQAGLLYRPYPNLVFGLGLVAGSTELDFRHNGGESTNDFVGVQADYMHRWSNYTGLTARAIWSDGSADTAIPLGTSGRTLSFEQDNERIYLEASLVTNFPSADFGFVPDGVRLRPLLTAMFQSTSHDKATDSLGNLRPASTQELGIVRAALRVESEERRAWHVVPYVVAGIEHEFRNTVSFVDDDPANSYIKTGLGMNLGSNGRADLFYTRRDSFEGTYTANQITLFVSLLF